MQVSIIIVNYNTKDLLCQCISSIYEKTKSIDYEIIVSDNGSIDGSIEMLKSKFPNVRIIENNSNLGFGKANNIGIQVAKGKYLFLLNSDTYLLNNSPKAFYDFMENNSNLNVACVGGDLLDEDGEKQPSYGNFPSVLDSFSQLGFYKFYESYYKNKVAVGVINESESIKEVDYICGADMFLRKSLMDKIGYFDEDFFLYYEETEMSFRINKSGYKSVLLPQIKIVHLEGGSQKKQNESLFKVSEMAKSRKLYFQKCHGIVTALIVQYISIFHLVILLIRKRDKKYLKHIKINYNV